MNNTLKGVLKYKSNSTLKGHLAYKGVRGDSAYEIAVQEGFKGDKATWLKQIGFEDINAKLPANVKNFGAVGDGVTDDTEAIQYVLDNYDDIYFPEGEYVISRPLYFETNNKHIRGVGVKNSIIRKVGHLGLAESKIYTYKEGSTVNFADYDALMIAGGYSGDFIIENLGFQGDEDGETKYGLLLGFTYRTTLNNLQISHCGQNIRYFVTWNTNIKKVRSQHGTYGFRIEGVNSSAPEQSTSVHFDNTFAEYCTYGYKGVNLTYFTGSAMSSDFIDEVCHWYKYCQGSINGMGIEQSKGQFIRNWLSNININGAYYLSNIKKTTKDADAKSTAKIEVWSENRQDTGLAFESGEFRGITGEGIDTLVFVDGDSYLSFNNIRLSGVRDALPEENDVIVDGSIFNINGRSWTKITSRNTIIDGESSLLVGNIDMKVPLLTYNVDGESRILPDMFVWLRTTNTQSKTISIPLSEIRKRYPNFMYNDTYVASPHRLSIYCNNGATLTDIFAIKKEVKLDNVKRFFTDSLAITSVTITGDNLVLTFNENINYVFVYITSI